jgi:carboxymethylenebutenolidase
MAGNSREGASMCDDDRLYLQPDLSMSRRTFGLTAVAAASLASTYARAAASVVERDVEIKTPDGVCDAAFYAPAGGRTAPAVLIWTDNRGLRPVYREMGKRLSAQGYAVLVPNPFYRKMRAPDPASFDFQNPETARAVTSLAGTLTPEGTMSDAVAFIGWLDAQKAVDKARKVGTQGYCMGGPLVFRTAAAVPGRVGAAMTCHGGGLATANPTSPHLLIPKMKAEVRVAVAKNDDANQPTAKDTLKAAFAEARLPATVEVSTGNHGWCILDNANYEAAAAEKAWAELSALYKARLV